VFEINNSSDRLKLLISDYEKLVRDPLNISLAEKACSDAWHLGDWVFKELQEIENSLSKHDFRKTLYTDTPCTLHNELIICCPKFGTQNCKFAL